MQSGLTRNTLPPKARLRVPAVADTPSIYEAFFRRDIAWPSGIASGWEDIHRLWFGGRPDLLINYAVMFGAKKGTDAALLEKFGELWQTAGEGLCKDWVEQPKSCIAQMLLLDQLGRNMFRGTPDAYKYDVLARQLSDRAWEHLASGAELHIEEAMMMAWPWLHSESLAELQRGCDWLSALAQHTAGTPYEIRILVHRYGADRHYRVVERFGRFPHRNAILGRASTKEELAYLINEAEVWEMDQFDFARGGTFRYFRTYLEYFMRTQSHFLKEGRLNLLFSESFRYAKRLLGMRA
jgi:uncharacterized protein (DUF924 family)